MADGTIRIGTKIDLSGARSDVKALEKELNRAQKEMDKLNAKEASIRDEFSTEREFDSQMPDEYSHKDLIDEREAEAVSKVYAEREAVNQKIQEYTALLDQANAKLQQQSAIAEASNELNGAVKSNAVLDKIKSQEDYNSLLEQTKAKMAEIESLAAGISANSGVSADAILAANPEYQKLASQMEILQSTTRQFGDEAQTAGHKAASGMKKAKKETNHFTSTVKSGIKKIAKMSLAILGIRGVYGAVRTAMNEYFAVNEKLEGQIATLKAGFGQILGPAIEWIVNLLMQAVSAVNSFVYALTGINFAAKANEAALKKQAKASKAAQNQLAGFDEMNKLTDSSGSGKDGVGSLDATVGALSAFAEKLKNQILGGDWYGAGKTIGTALMEGIENIDWSSIGSKIGEVVGGSFALVLGFASAFDFETVRDAACELLASFLASLSDEVQKIDWRDVGKTLLDLLLLGIAINNPFVAIVALFLSPNGDELAKSASEFIGSLVGALAAALVGAGERIAQIASDLWNKLKSSFDGYVDWEGTPEEIIDGLWEGIKNAISGVGRWIYDNIWVPFRDGFKAAFEIHSPSKKMEGFGKNIIDGLLQGIKGGIDKIRQACVDIWTAIKSKFSNVSTWFKDTFSKAWSNVKDVFSTGGKVFDGIKDGISSTFKTIVNGLIDGINKVISVPFNSINSMLNKIRSVNVLGISPFANMWSYNPLSVPQIPKLALGGIVNRPGRGVLSIIGEAGKEAVLPLENNTEWMDVLAEKIGMGTLTIPITIDGKKIATYIVDLQAKKAFAMNGA